MNFSNLKGLKTPRGNVVELAIDGKIAWKKVLDLPNGYTRVEYLESTRQLPNHNYGAQKINTGVVLNERSSVRLRFQITDTSQKVNVFGSRKSATEGNFLLWCDSNAKLTFDYRSYTENRFTESIAKNTMIDIWITPTKYVINGTEYAISGTGAFQTPQTMLLFNASGSSSTTLGVLMKLYECEIYDGDTLIRDFWPCTNSSSVAGLYDIANGVLYTDTVGNVAFAVGPSVA